MRVALVVVVASAAGCIPLASGAYLCDDAGKCPDPFVCSSEHRCVDAKADAGFASDAGFVDAGDVDAGEVDAGEVDAGSSGTLSFTTVSAGSFDDVIVAVSAVLDDTGHPHVAVWSRKTSAPLAERVQYATCTGACTNNEWRHVIVDGNVAGLHAHPSITVDASGRPRIVYESGGGMRAAACDASCAVSTSSWATAGVLANGTSPRIVRDGDALLALSCAGVLEGADFTVSKCAAGANCGTSAGWTSTSLALTTCTDVVDAVVDNARVVAMLAKRVGGVNHLVQATCTGGGTCATSTQWSANDLGVTASAPIARYRFMGADGAAFFDVDNRSVSTCTSCAPAIPSAGGVTFSSTTVDGAGDLEVSGTVLHVVGTAYLACDSSASSCASESDWTKTQLPSAALADLVVDASGIPDVVTASDAALSWSSGRD